MINSEYYVIHIGRLIIKMESVEFSKIKKIANEYDLTIKTTDPRRYRSVMIIHRDEGTVLTYDHSFALKYDNWYMVFPEHHPAQIFHEDDVDIFQRGERIEVEYYQNERL